VLVLADFAHPRFSMTPHLRKVTRQIINKAIERDIRGRAALYLQNGLETQAMSLFLRTVRIFSREAGLTPQVFTSREAALDWLRQLT
jgi:hypothetical protein